MQILQLNNWQVTDNLYNLKFTARNIEIPLKMNGCHGSPSENWSLDNLGSSNFLTNINTIANYSSIEPD